MDSNGNENEHGAPNQTFLPDPQGENFDFSDPLACIASWLPDNLTPIQQQVLFAMHKLVMTAPIVNGTILVTRASLKRDTSLQEFIHPVYGVLLPNSELVSRLHTHADLSSGIPDVTVHHADVMMSEEELRWFVIPGTANPWVYPDWSEVLQPDSLPVHMEVDPALMYINTLAATSSAQLAPGQVINPLFLMHDPTSISDTRIPTGQQSFLRLGQDTTPVDQQAIAIELLQTQAPAQTPSQQIALSPTPVFHSPAASNSAFEPNFSLSFDLSVFDFDPRFNRIQRESIKAIHGFIRAAPRLNGRPHFTKEDLATAGLTVRGHGRRLRLIIAPVMMNLSTRTELVRSCHTKNTWTIDSEFSADDLHLSPTQLLWLAKQSHPGDLWPPAGCPAPPYTTPAAFPPSEHSGTPMPDPTAPIGLAVPEEERLPDIDLTQRRALSEPLLRYLHHAAFQGFATDNRSTAEVPEVPFVTRRVNSELIARAPRPVPTIPPPDTLVHEEMVDWMVRVHPDTVNIARRQFGVDLSVLPMTTQANMAESLASTYLQPFAQPASELSPATLGTCMIDPVSMTFPTPLPMPELEMMEEETQM